MWRISDMWRILDFLLYHMHQLLSKNLVAKGVKGLLVGLYFCVKYLLYRVRNVKFATYMKFATCGNTNKMHELR